MLWCGDFNRHHPMWDEERNHHLFTAAANRAAEELISLLADYNMVMTLPKRVPTLQSMATKNWTRVDNIFCTDNAAEAVITCDTNPSLRGPGTDHVPVLTVLDMETRLSPPAPFRNFRMVDWKQFREQLAENLEAVPGLKELTMAEGFDEAVAALTDAIQATIEAAVPLSSPVLHSRWWWSRELTTLKKAKNRLNNASYIHRAIADHPSHQEHRKVSEEYGAAIKKAKVQHWEEYLESLDDHLLWSANRYLANLATDGGKSRVPSLRTTTADGGQQTAETNKEKSGLLATTFFPPKPAVSQVPPDYRYPRRVPYSFRLQEGQLRRQISKLKSHKAPGDDGIPNIVLKELVDLIAEYLLHIYRATFALR
jgi:Endonuclease-reverse transcriptase